LDQVNLFEELLISINRNNNLISKIINADLFVIAGWGVKVQIAAFKQAGLEVAALWCRTEDKVAGLKNMFPGIELITSDYARILAEESIQLVCVTRCSAARTDLNRSPSLHRRTCIAACLFKRCMPENTCYVINRPA